MISLVFIVCLQAQPDVCRERQLTFSASELTPRRCVMQAQTRLAEWAQSHPRWTISRWRCGATPRDKTI